ncbi:MAG: asparagine synthase-related protein [Bacteroidota bacterium]
MKPKSIIQNPILPSEHHYVQTKDQSGLFLEAICIFAATGFFMDDDTFWKNMKCLLSAHDHQIDEKGFLIKSTPNFNWHYSPRTISFDAAVEEYIELLTLIIKEQVGRRNIILPLSGGLDSRSQALIIKTLDNPVFSYSYSFSGGYPEQKIAAKIAQYCNFDFSWFVIPKGYLWETIDDIALINGCYSEFTHARQMAIIESLKNINGVFSLGHWGDVLFDKGANIDNKNTDMVAILIQKMLKPGGLYLAEELWKHWGLNGSFIDYLRSRIKTSLSQIHIENISAKIRAFKTSQWAHRWTTTNLSVFAAANPITTPFYDNRMYEFICTLPEEYLSDRRIQIAHLKRDDAISRITWHAQKPFNLKNFEFNKSPYNWPYRIINKLKRESKGVLGRPFIQRNYEIQFLGKENDKNLRERLFSKSFHEMIPEFIIQNVYENFKNNNNVFYSHPTSMLLTLSLWHQHFFSK